MTERTVRAALVLGVLAAGAAGAQQTGQPAPSSPGWLEIEVAPLASRPPEDESAIEGGRKVYDFRCSPCHGMEGDAQGPVAPYLDPRPRDFTFANFKLRTTKSGELPLDEDLFRTVTRGIPGTAMPSWSLLSEEERWQVVYYVKFLARDWFADETMDPHRTEDGETFLVEVPAPPKATPELLERGKAAFLRGKCEECHGDNVRGNGTSAGRQFNYLEQRILPADLTKGWKFKGGSRVEDIWKTLTAGWNGTPMPSFIGAFNQDESEADFDERWAVAHYISSITRTEPESEETLLKVRKVDGELPQSPTDPAWDEAREIHFRLFGQATRRPRWQIPAVDHVRVRALYNDTEFAVRLVYHDRSESREHTSPDILDEPTSYPEIDVEDYEDRRLTFRDAVALQFPVKPQQGAVRPYFLYGQMDKPVNLWRYLADRDGFEEATARGADKIAAQDDDDQSLGGVAEYDDGAWRVVFKRPLVTEAKGDVQLKPGRYIPFAVMAWDGGSGESGLRQSLSSWYNLVLDAPISGRLYARAGAGVLLVALLELFLLWKAGTLGGGKQDSGGEGER